MIVITVARKPLAAPTVAANVLKYGTGALNIDACRISTGGNEQLAGRWPANLVLQHFPGCRSVAAGGLETIPAWSCEPGCPVTDLDAQSGITTSTGGQFSGGNAFGQDSGWNKTNVYRKEIERPDDTGGASRFFKQVGGSDG